MIKRTKAKKIIFRADGNSNIGLGHLYRLFALSEIYKDHYECVFVTKKDSTLSIFLREHKLIIIPDDVTISEESKWLLEYFKSSDYLIILDGYQFDVQYQKRLKEIGYNLMFIDDYAQENDIADVIVNHSLSVNNSDFKSSRQARLGLGSKYAILRPQFLEEAKKNKKVHLVKKAFICFGGADFNNLTNRCLKGIVNIEELEEIHVVIGNAYKDNEIYKTIEENEEKISLHKNLNEEEMVKL
ncbi:UDP-2,4-diacetamido-2,4,6-trideoxy-beta-L-altropyranose hydrolase, partial [Flavobacteriaceae bacterium]|nr:UDP-2,4-diacetamido-2,4,6-trideoxy-beta-L-altropyranose hydrolase [Flavobacteriaceae bacterium]